MAQNNKYLDYDGVGHLWNKIKGYIDEYILIPKYVSNKSEITNEGLYRTMLGATLTTIKDGKVYLDTTQLTTTKDMFSGCSGLTSLDLSKFNTSSVTDMSNMFRSCSKLTSLDLSKFNTSSVTNMSYMFAYCSGLTSFDIISNFDTSKVTNMSYMFAYCSGLTSIDLSKLGLSDECDMSNMFAYCSKLTSIDYSNTKFHRGSMLKMFINCRSLTSANFINLSDLGFCDLRQIYNMFAYCSKLTSLNFPGFGHISSGPDVFDLSSCPLDHDSLMSIFTVDRKYEHSQLSVKLSSTSKALLTDEEKAAITAKGYTIA